MHLSRLAEEIVIWASPGYRFVILSDRFSTGSSIMPQKRNPDAAELVRAKTGRITGASVALSMVMKGLPLAYSKDMQEDKEQVFDAADSLMLATTATAAMVSTMKPDRERMREMAIRGFPTATDLADWLVRELDVAFRDAHHMTGRLVKQAEDRECALHELALEDIRAICGQEVSRDVFSALSVEESVASRRSYGGTAPERVREQVLRWREQMASLRERSR